MLMGALVSGALMTVGIGLLALVALGGIGGGGSAGASSGDAATPPWQLSAPAAALATIQAAPTLQGDLSLGNAARGETLFNTFQPDAGFACATCHLPNSEERLIGPGLLNVGTRAATRVEGLTAWQYIYQSITEPDVYVVENFSADLMPENWTEIYSFDDIRDIMAYLLTLEE